jgi:hypothetical protein
MIGHVDYGKITLTQATTETLVGQWESYPKLERYPDGSLRDRYTNPELYMNPENIPAEETPPIHVYDWLDLPPKDDGEKVAKEWLEQFVKPAEDKDHAWLNSHRLTCEYEGERYRCVGASAMGDVWLTSKIRNPVGYEKRVEVESLSNWERVEVEIKPRRTGKVGALLAATAMLGAPGFRGRRPSSYDERHDPDRPKTDKDLANIEAARLKRERKAARKS